MCKSSKPRPIKINSQRVMRCHKDINSQIEFFVPDQEGIVNVSLNDVSFRLVRHIRPVADFIDVSEEKDAFSLTSSDLRLVAKITGFIIQRVFSLSLLLLNSSRKIGYSLGKL